MKRLPVLVTGMLACGDATQDHANLDELDQDPQTCPEASTFLDVSQAPGPGPGYPAPSLGAACDDDQLVVQSNAIPHYSYVSLTPNALVEQDFEWRIPRNATVAAEPTDIALLGLIAFTVSGLPIYGPNEGGFPDPYGDPVYNDIVDGCKGHTADAYHNHALAEKCLTASGLVAEPWTLPDPDPTTPSPVIGWSLDGFPIYGPRGCSDSECTSVVTYTSGWTRIGDPTTYAWDAHQYFDDADPLTLDRCNGHVGPDGDYHYHATATFPYILGCYSGSPSTQSGNGSAGGEMGGQAGGDTQSGSLPTCDEVSAGMPCCGDGICDGPETTDNCSSDCR